MQVRFADRLPEGEFALVIPAQGADADSVRNLGGALTDALTRQRFDGEAGSVAEHFHEGRRVVVVTAVSSALMACLRPVKWRQR